MCILALQTTFFAAHDVPVTTSLMAVSHNRKYLATAEQLPDTDTMQVGLGRVSVCRTGPQRPWAQKVDSIACRLAVVPASAPAFVCAIGCSGDDQEQVSVDTAASQQQHAASSQARKREQHDHTVGGAMHLCFAPRLLGRRLRGCWLVVCC
jgi:hypothetical protein